MKITVAVALTCLFADIQGMAFQARQTKSQRENLAPRFDVVSIKPCPASATTGSTRITPSRFMLECATVEGLIRTAFLIDGVLLHEAEALVKDGPAWVRSSRFTIEAVTEKPIISGDTKGLLVQDMLKRRFKLKMREDVQTLRVYDLIQAQGGAKLRASKDSSCFQLVAGQPPQASGGKPPATICGGFRRSFLGEVDVSGITMASFCKKMSSALERDVIDKTGLPGVYDFHLETTLDALSPFRYRQASTSAPQDADEGPSGSIFTAVRKLGLRLVPSTRPSKVIVIDHVEIPDAN